MNKIVSRCIALLLCIIMIVGMIPNVSAATYNVNQSRRIAEINEFPISYRAGLTRIKSIYPNAQFVYYDVDLDWYTDVLSEENEMRHGVNLIPSNSPSSWKSTDPKSYDPVTNTYTQVEPGWNQASVELVEYYMDPRNFFNEVDIFQFLDLSFNGSETVKGVEGVLKGSFMAGKTIVDNNGKDITYAEALYQIGKETGVSPYLLACRIRQEQGGGGSSLISGTYSKVPGYYNYFNICASGSTTEKIITNGLNYAKSHGWNTPYKSILGGAGVLADNYVGAGKNCLYLQHFNMTARNHVVNYSVYMANTLAPYHENKMMAKSLTDKNANYTFIIPVYDNMPESPCDLPDGDGNASYILKSLTLNGGEVNIGKFSSHKYNYVATTNDLSFMSIKASTQFKTSKIAINGIDIDMKDSTTIEKAVMLNSGFNDFVITVTAENGLCRDYVLEVINDDGNPHYRALRSKLDSQEALINAGQLVSDLKSDIETLNCSVLVVDADGKIKDNTAVCVSGDTLMIKTHDNKMAYSATITIDGDVNCDGYLTDADLDMIKSHILEMSTLTLTERDFADMDKDGEITVKDLAMIKVLISGEFDSYEQNISIVPNVPENIFDGKSANITLNATSGTYFAEGYLVYNEGRATPKSGENSGKIHFIADSNKILFDTNSSKVAFQSVVRSGSLNFSVEIVQAYDYTTNEEIEIVTDVKSMHIKNAELEVSVTLNEAATEGYKNHHVATLQIKNTSSMSIGNINVNLGEYFSNDAGKQSIDLNGLKPGKSHTLKLYILGDLESGQYNPEIKIQYQDAICVESLVCVPLAFEILNHDHEDQWKSDGTRHFTTCKTCNEEKSEDHVYIKTADGAYECLVCGYSKTLATKISISSDPIVNKSTTISAVANLNGHATDVSKMKFTWFVDGVKVSDKSSFSTIFKSVGNHTITCVMTNTEGLTTTDLMNVYVAQQQSKNQSVIAVSNVTCSSISLKNVDGYEYKLDDGEWQQAAIFTKLTPGKEYTVHQRQIGKAWTATNVVVVTNHKVPNYKMDLSKCESETTMSGMCLFCRKTNVVEFPGTKLNHVFMNYDVTSEATCQRGTVETSACEYGCGETKSRTLNDVQYHQFTNYRYDNNSTCESGGTSTAFCNYNCGTSDIVPMKTETSGHAYVYRANNDATIESSMTETGICTHCGKSNTRTIDGTRLAYVTEIHVELTTAMTQTTGLPAVTTGTEGVVVVGTTWKNSGGVEFDGNAKDVVIKNGETYKLTSLVLKVDSKHAFYDTVILYVNGQVFTGVRNMVDGTITFVDVGQFKF